tara:strand:- start:44 stop:892 length:849 start_codon:yes stop_codon:yes gene_type:complete
MRISSAGDVQLRGAQSGSDGSFANLDGYSTTDSSVLSRISFLRNGADNAGGISFHVDDSASLNQAMIIANAGNTTITAGNAGGYALTLNQTVSANLSSMRFTAHAPDGRSNYFSLWADTGANRCIIYSDGDIENHDNSYGAISDLKLKQDITDVRDYWDDFKALRFRKFKFKTDVEAYGDDAQSLFGVVAQEAELVFPGLIEESPDTEQQQVAVLDEDGNPTYEVNEAGESIPITEEKQVDLGTTTKGFKYSILSQIGLKVVQELQSRLETAEAKITALESA